ncbi:uncharacterized protein LOC132699520 [Cylas formicarius]|uniref:uncharacterized protein LOC132699520 n=1 Tax=Cylas formicarius TaxID=197179 RepID=UPI0029586512|nr:uncharacterized protein LOC132699520 [Cylas formicarius]XP_060522271.1 uncharacterized protein LOC132699520 [Cylas formicarius]
MPQGPQEDPPPQPQAQARHNPLIKPFVVLALPGMYLFYKYNQYKRKRKENATRRLAEKELQHLNGKIEKLLSKLEESEPELATCQEEECVICIHAKATMQTSPCGHQVVCRKCFVKTIQIAVSQRLLPLRCVICRAKILRLKTSPMFPTSASGYSMTSRTSSVPQSDSLYSVSSGGSSISSTSCSSDGPSKDPTTSTACCAAHCNGGLYSRQPTTGAIRRSQKQAMKITLQDYCRPEKSHVNRLPPIKELPGSSPLHSVPPASTRIRCAQKIVTQLEMPLLGRSSRYYKYEKLSQEDEEARPSTSGCAPEKTRRWWSDRSKNEEKIDNRKNEITEKQMELKERVSKTDRKCKEKTKLLSDESL